MSAASRARLTDFSWSALPHDWALNIFSIIICRSLGFREWMEELTGQSNIELKRIAAVSKAQAKERVAAGTWIHQPKHKVAGAVRCWLDCLLALTEWHRCHGKQLPTVHVPARTCQWMHVRYIVSTTEEMPDAR